MEMKRIFGQNLKKYRKERGLLQKELAQMMGVSMYTVSVWERGLQMPGVKTIENLARIFSVPPKCLYTEGENKVAESLEDALAETVEVFLKKQREFYVGEVEYVVTISVNTRAKGADAI